jgi:hypothetical protein
MVIVTMMGYIREAVLLTAPIDVTAADYRLRLKCETSSE